MKSIEKLLLTTGLVFQFLMGTGCGASKEPLSAETWDQLEQVVTVRSFHFQAQWAEPLQTGSMNQVANAGLIPPGSNVNRIDLTGTANYFKMQGDAVEMQLPYYGERQINQTYGRAEGMAYQGTATDISTKKNEKNGYYDLDFNLNNKTELLQCSLRVFPGMRTILTIYSSQRNMIRYVGELKPQEAGF
jgi:hypothetical protein